jgi:serine phosphatase RsbU (regulator of sigma subunit)
MAGSTGAGSALGPSPHPVDLPHIETLDLKAQYHSPRCGGDFFDAVVLGSRVVFLLTDIAGRRPQTHAIAIEIQNVFRTQAEEVFRDAGANESEGVALLARDINRSLIEAAGGVRLTSAFLGCYNLALNILTYQHAGHLLVLFHDGEKACVLEPCGIPLGLFTHSTYEPAVLAFEPHAKLLLVTKGGSTGGRRKAAMFDDERIRPLLEKFTTDAAFICEGVLQAASGPGKHSRAPVHNFLRSRSRRDCEDLTAVALVRRATGVEVESAELL